MIEGDSNYEARLKYYMSSQKDPFTLDVSGKQILDAKIINAEFENRSQQNLSHLIIANNFLVTLELYSKTLLSLNASNNFLLKVVLSINSLQELNLSHNCLEQVPNLRTMKKLQILKLSYNYIVTLNEKALPKNLVDLDLSNNLLKIDMEIDNAFENFCNKFGRFKSIKTIELNKNPFEQEFPEYATLLRHYCPVSIEIKNSMTKISPERRNTIIKPQDGQQPQLKQMLEHLNRIKKSPATCADELNKLQALVDAAKENIISFENSLEAINPTEFFENLDIIHSGQHKYRKEIYVILAKLIYLRLLREKATEALSMYMRSSLESREMALTVLERVIVRELKKFTREKFPMDVVLSLCAIAEVCNISSILKRILRSFSAYLNSLKSEETTQGVKIDSRIINCLLGILAAGFKDNLENVKLVMEISNIHEEDSDEDEQTVEPEDFAGTIKYFLLQENLAEAPTSMGSKKYDYILQIIIHCSAQFKKAGKLFFDMTFEIFVTYLKISYSLYNELQKETTPNKEKAKAICKRFSSELVCCARMISSPLIDITKIVNDEYMLSSVRNILSILTRPSIDPFVLSALCELILSLFNQSKVKDNDKVNLSLIFSLCFN